MAEIESTPVQVPLDQRPYDGRFGERFDDEIDTGAVVKTVVGVMVITVISTILIIFFWRWLERGILDREPEDSPVAEANQRLLPPTPRLQAEPENELIAMRREMRERLDSYGWADQSAGLAHIPIDRAIDLVVERGVGALTSVGPAVEPDTPVDDTPVLEGVAIEGEAGG